MDEKETLLEAIRTAVNAAGGKRVTRQQFLNSSGFKVADIFRHFPNQVQPEKIVTPTSTTPSIAPTSRYQRLTNRPTYGNPIDFRGLRHEPVNENGVVFLFGIVARELGFLVEAVQAGFPDCEAKRQIAPGKWQRVRIEFEYESRNFLAHGHDVDGCDVIVCWHYNWADCPGSLEVVELCSLIQSLSASDV